MDRRQRLIEVFEDTQRFYTQNPKLITAVLDMNMTIIRTSLENQLLTGLLRYRGISLLERRGSSIVSARIGRLPS